MSPRAADISVELPPVDQVKLVLMRGITAKLAQRFGTQPGAQSRASREIDLDEAVISRLRAGRCDRFSIERLVDLCDQIGVEITITAR